MAASAREASEALVPTSQRTTLQRTRGRAARLPFAG
eukprot:CAMPEP_0206058026 /NCGR_PEP_ID=MMETSP1466-20131121/45716_1 /ASSEMBLY_ACC=CAM_ASM_001126 /TAXON_ID=44452 /ORGANISM="Pavlova gyrans, Strain CCMP608" /LENGTH=35 /DNA_ID= /DNA_START= /DNA_END= /DNA_ORIENTATION=